MLNTKQKMLFELSYCRRQKGVNGNDVNLIAGGGFGKHNVRHA